ncbi:nuclear protein, variant 3 [Coprinopsis cinerea AmutBmut pab1-1]|nr:nuclear protein, variant 3 [Coprinopsis cinerea AmutBmut pab1-1]
MSAKDPPRQSRYASDSEASEEEGQQFKRRRRLHGACDACKKKKTKCDSALMPDRVCSNCINSKIECAHTIPRQKKRDRQQEYILQLEEKIRKLEEVLGASSADTHSSPSATHQTESSRHTSPSSGGGGLSDIRPPIPQTMSGAGSPSSTEEVKMEDWDSDDGAGRCLAERMGLLAVDCHDNRFFGKASLISFVSQIAELSREPNEEGISFVRRPAIWDLRPWEREYADSPEPIYEFPETDLLESLLVIYGERVHPQLPVLHWPSFLRDVRSGRHFKDPGFGMILLAACATASRYTADERVIIVDHENPDLSGPSAGWRFIAQTPLVRKSIIAQATILDLQYYALIVFYFLGTSSPHTAWNLLGIAMRFAIEMGLHRRKGAASPKTKAQSELEKRIFWSLLTLEWLTSTSLGRPPCLHDEDIDIDYPIECDDEYWDSEVDDPEKAWKQPPNKPSLITAMNFHLKLCEIAAFMLRTLYSSKKSKVLTGSIGEQWERRIVSELDSAMNRWKDGLPQHLRWDPSHPDIQVFNQQVLLHSAFYYLQIQIHRPFLQGQTTLALPALAMCTNAARATSRLVDATMKRQSFSSVNTFAAAFAASTVLVINLWGRRGPKLSYLLQKEVEDIQCLLRFLKSGGERWHIAGRFGDILTEFCSLGGLPVPLPESQDQSRKRTRDESNAPRQSDIFAALVSTFPSDPQIFDKFTSAPNPNPSDTGAGSSSSGTPVQFSDQGGPSQSQFSGHLPPSNPDWDLSTLLLTQLGYAEHANPAFNFPSTTPTPATTNSALQPPFNLDNNPIPGTNPFTLVDNNVLPSSRDTSAMSMWMTAPTAWR